MPWEPAGQIRKSSRRTLRHHKASAILEELREAFSLELNIWAAPEASVAPMKNFLFSLCSLNFAAPTALSKCKSDVCPVLYVINGISRFIIVLTGQ